MSFTNAKDDFECGLVFTAPGPYTPMEVILIDPAHLADSGHELWKVFYSRQLLVHFTDRRIDRDGLLNGFHSS